MLSATIGGNSWTNPHLSKITGIKLGGGNFSSKSDTPIGSIIPIMGTKAPQDYLICDGRILQISEYKQLADFFKDQFGSSNHFGGDGTTTFAIPDLRNEFLRGYHNGGDAQLSGDIGIHQDATKQYALQVSYSTKRLQFGNPVDWSVNYGYDTNDTRIDGTDGYQSIDGVSGAQKPMANGNVGGFTARPTNVAVLFCIKYTESASGSANVNKKEFGLFNYKQTSDCTTYTDIVPTADYNESAGNYISVNSEGRPILKAGKSYKIEIIPVWYTYSGANGVAYAGLTTDKNDYFGGATFCTVNRSAVGSSSLNYIHLFTPTEDTVLHVTNGVIASSDKVTKTASIAITSWQTNVLITEL